MIKKLTFLALAIALISACTQNPDSNKDVVKGELITEFIAYDVQIETDTTGGYPIWLNNIAGDGRTSLQQQLLDNAREGKFQMYSDMDGTSPMSWEEFYEKTTVKNIMWDETEEGMADTGMAAITEIQAEEITTIRFLEKWTFTPDKTGIQKEIIGFAPLKAVFHYNGAEDAMEFFGYQDLFWVRYDK